MKSCFIFLLMVPSQLALSQGATAIPDDLDCNNLTADQAHFADYCNERAALKKSEAAFAASYTSVKKKHDALTEIAALREKGWEKISAKNYGEAVSFFNQALALNQQHKVLGPVYAADMQSVVSAIKKQASASKTNASRDFWRGGGSPAHREKEKDSIPPPWYNIHYECFASDAEGLEILQVVKDSGPDFIEVEVHLRFNDLHPRYHKNVLLRRYLEFGTRKRKRWVALINAGLKNGSVWVAPETLRIPRTWRYDDGRLSYTATWDDRRQRYRLTSWPDETPYKAFFENKLFAVTLECYQHDDLPPSEWEHYIRL